jgi:hypothetical protein
LQKNAVVLLNALMQLALYMTKNTGRLFFKINI